MSENIKELNEGNFDAEVSAGLVLVDFWAPWCGPCRMQAPILERLADSKEISGNIMKVNTDESPAIAQKYGISGIPTLILFKDGKEVERMVGVQTETALKAKLA